MVRARDLKSRENVHFLSCTMCHMSIIVMDKVVDLVGGGVVNRATGSYPEKKSASI